MLRVFADPERAEHAALVHWAASHGVPLPAGERNEAAVVRALLRAGAEALQEQALEQGYAELAKTFAGGDERDEARALRARYARRIDTRYAE